MYNTTETTTTASIFNTIKAATAEVLNDAKKYCKPMAADAGSLVQETAKATVCTAGLTMRTANVVATGTRIGIEEIYGCMPTDEKELKTLWNQVLSGGQKADLNFNTHTPQ